MKSKSLTRYSLKVKRMLARLARECRENIAAFEGWEHKPRIGPGARGEARGTVATSREFLAAIRGFRKALRK